MRRAWLALLVVGCHKAPSFPPDAASVRVAIVDAAPVKPVDPKVERAHDEAGKLADLYPRWARDNPDDECPKHGLDELRRYASGGDGKDPWGAPYVLECEDTGTMIMVVVSSPGPDGKPNTDDDVRSNDL